MTTDSTQTLDSRSIRLIRIAQTLAAKRTLPELAAAACEYSRELLSSDGVSFAVLEDEQVHHVDESAIQPLFKGRRVPSKACICGWAINNAESAAIADILADNRIDPENDYTTSVKSIAVAPVGKAPAVAAIVAYWGAPHFASQEELELLGCLADSVALSFENIRLFESQQRQVSSLDELNRLKDEFLAMVSHELRTPLNGVLGWSELLLQKEDLNRKEIELGIGTIAACAKTQKRLVDDLIDASSIAHGDRALQRSTFDLLAAVRSSVSAFQPEADAAGVRLEFEKTAEPLPFHGDEPLLRQALGNILANAIKFSNRGSVAKVLLRREEDQAVIKVADQGIGIPPEFVEHVFERFRQRDSSYTRRHPGLGLGLFISRHIVQKHKGTVSASSDGLGRGATFCIALPLSLDQQASDPSATREREADRHPLKDLTIMVVDDSEADLDLLSRLLAATGARPIACPSTNEALERIAKEKIHVLICDLGMPGEDGISFIKRLRQLAHPRSSVPAIAHTAFATPEDESRAKAAGFNAFCRKPIRLAELTALIKGLV